MALSGGSHGGEFTSAFGGAAEVNGRTASAAFDANDPKQRPLARLLQPDSLTLLGHSRRARESD
jgi:hypothetical protein